MDLPGHEDEVSHDVHPEPMALKKQADWSSQVYAVSWAADGKMVASGGKDKAVRTWRN